MRDETCDAAGEQFRPVFKGWLGWFLGLEGGGGGCDGRIRGERGRAQPVGRGVVG